MLADPPLLDEVPPLEDVAPLEELPLLEDAPLLLLLADLVMTVTAPDAFDTFPAASRAFT